jgi:hypothetical protein
MTKFLYCVLVVCQQTIPEPTRTCSPGEMVSVPYQMREQDPGHFVAMNERPITIRPGATISVECKEDASAFTPK